MDPQAPETPPPPTPPEENPDQITDKKVRTWAAFVHLSGLLALIGIPFANILGPLAIWLLKRNEMPQIDAVGKEALNFQISFSVYSLICIPFFFILIGIPMIIALGIAWLVLTIIAAVKASNGEFYEYPLIFRLIN